MIQDSARGRQRDHRTARKVFGVKSARDNDNARGLMTMRGWCRRKRGTLAMRGNNSWERNVRWMLEISASSKLNRVTRPSRLRVCSKYPTAPASWPKRATRQIHPRVLIIVISIQWVNQRGRSTTKVNGIIKSQSLKPHARNIGNRGY